MPVQLPPRGLAPSPVPLLLRDEVANAARAVRCGDLVRVTRGVYAPAAPWHALAPWERYLARVHAVARTHAGAALVLESAAAVRNLPVFGEPPDVHLLLPEPATSRRAPGVRMHTTQKTPALERIDGVLVATSAETRARAAAVVSRSGSGRGRSRRHVVAAVGRRGRSGRRGQVQRSVRRRARGASRPQRPRCAARQARRQGDRALGSPRPRRVLAGARHPHRGRTSARATGADRAARHPRTRIARPPGGRHPAPPLTVARARPCSGAPLPSRSVPRDRRFSTRPTSKAACLVEKRGSRGISNARGARAGRRGGGQSSKPSGTADSVPGMPSAAAFLSAIASRRRMRPATASFVSGGSAW